MNSPIDAILAPLCRSLSENSAVVLQAPPGAGKTTRVPLALIDQPWLAGKTILMLQPRRLAARHAAEYMAEQVQQRVGQSIGYQIRFERKISAQTRIEIVTEGILTRRLQNDPELNGVGLVIFDEFHERNLQSDLALALCRDAQTGLRDDLKLLIMSATLAAEPVAELLGGCPVLTSEGRCFPVETRYLPQPSEQNIAEKVAAGVRTALRETCGDILAFLPGAGEIRRCAALLVDQPEVDICPLYGGLPFAEQRQAIAPGWRRRVVLATNIAETSLTIEGITTVVDSGWERRPRFDVASGLTRLELKMISAASAGQRQGRAGRLAPGVCYRLWSAGQQAALLPQTPPEIRTADLSSLLLELACWGETDPQRLAWLDPPSETHLQQAKSLLQTLKALDRNGQATPLGRQLLRLPLPPRLARLLLAAREDGAAALGCELAALLSERDLLPNNRQPVANRCDLEARWRLLHSRSAGDAARQVARTAADLCRIVKASLADSRWPEDATPLQRWLALAWPDRIARQREPGSARYLLSGGGGALLSGRSALQRPPLLVALELLPGTDQSEIVLASTLDQALLEQLFASELQPHRQIAWDPQKGRVVARELVALGALILRQRPLKASAAEQLEGLLQGLELIGVERLNWSLEADQLRARVARCRESWPEEGWPDLSFSALQASAAQWLSPYLSGISSRAALERFDPLPALKSLLPWALRKRLDRLAPERIEIPSGSRIRINYAVEGPPVLAAKLQELFGLTASPRLFDGRQALLIQLLSPAARPLAQTQDLRHFWDQVYPEIRKEMRGRYPKHPWPEDPWMAQATARTKWALRG